MKPLYEILKQDDTSGEYMPLHLDIIEGLAELEQGEKRVTHILRELFNWYIGTPNSYAQFNENEEHIIWNATKRLEYLQKKNVNRINGRKGGRPRKNGDFDISLARPEDYHD